MKKKILTILTLVITLNSLLLTMVNSILVRKQYASIIEQRTVDIIQRVKHQFVSFEKVIATLEKEVEDIGVGELLSVYGRIEEAYSQPFDVDVDFLDSLIPGTIFDHFYVIDRNGIVVTTTLEADQDLDLFSTGDVMLRILSSVYGEGEAVCQGFSISNMTGTKRIFFYFSPPGEDWILEASVNIEEYVADRYSPDYAVFLFSDFFLPPVSEYSFLVDLDIYLKTSISSWSLIEPGRELGDSEILRRMGETDKLVREEGDTVRIYIPVVLKNVTSLLTSKQNVILELVFDISLFARIRRMTYLVSFLVFIVCAAVFSFIASRMIDGRFIRPLEDLKIVLRKAAEGDYSPRVGPEADIEEIGMIFASTNQLLNLISDREEKLTLQSEALNRSLKQKDLLLMEIHHRVKNNLQVMASLISLQQSTIDNPVVIEALQSTSNRISAMAAVHSSLYEVEDYSRVDFKRFINRHLDTIFRSYGMHEDAYILEVSMRAESIDLTSAIPCALILTELVTNSIKHVSPGNGDKLRVRVLIEEVPGGYRMVMRDNGKGLPDDFNTEDTTSMGLTIVTSLVDQLNGTIEFSSNNGLLITITFPAV